MQSDQGALVINGLPPERQLNVIRRLSHMRQVELAVIKIIEDELKKQMANKKYIRIGGIDKVAETLINIDPGTRDNIMENLSYDDPELTEDIRNSMQTLNIERNSEDW